MELLFVMQSILCWAVLIIKCCCYLLKVAAWRSPHQSPPGYFCHSSTSFSNFSQHEEETSHTQSDWSFHCHGPGMTLLGRTVQQHLEVWLTQAAKPSATFKLPYLTYTNVGVLSLISFSLSDGYCCIVWFCCLIQNILFGIAVNRFEEKCTSMKVPFFLKAGNAPFLEVCLP